MPQISIIIPFKNAAPWLKETIESIIAQVGDWELICVDDYSDDDGPTSVLEYSELHKNITIIPNEGYGIIDALQTGFKQATGEFITRMDADDLMPLGRLQLMSEALSESPANTIVTGKVKYFADGELSEGFKTYESWMNERVDQNDFYDQIFRECTVASPNWMGRTQEFKDCQLFDQLNYPEDYDLLFRWYKNDFTIKGLDEVTLLWRDHPTRTSKNSETYSQQALFELKIDWYSGLHPAKTIALLGAGTKGKITAEILLTQGREVTWYDLMHANFNTPVLGIPIQDYNEIKEDVLLIGIYPKDRTELEAFITNKGYTIGENAWYL